jgi:hypothetical protein
MAPESGLIKVQTGGSIKVQIDTPAYAGASKTIGPQYVTPPPDL